MKDSSMTSLSNYSVKLLLMESMIVTQSTVSADSALCTLKASISVHAEPVSPGGLLLRSFDFSDH